MKQSNFSFCKNCHTPNSRPWLTFDDRGICTACIFHQNKSPKINWAAREEEFKIMCKEIKSKKNNYDCVVPFSGGKDSASIAYKLKFKYGLNPLLVTFAPIIQNEIGMQNRAEMNKMGFTNILVTPNDKISRNLSKRFLIERGNPKIHWNAGIAAAPIKIASDKKIDLIFYAEDPMLVYGGRITKTDSTRHMTVSRINETWIGDDVMNWVDENITEYDLEPYNVPLDYLKNQRAVFFGYFFPWDIVKNYTYIKEKINFKVCKDRSVGTFTNFDSLDDIMDDLYYYMQYIKFGFGRCTRDVSRHIQYGHMSTKEGKDLIKKYDGEFPKKNLKIYQDYFNLNEDDFIKIINSHRSSDIWKKKGNNFELINKLD